jgi:putative transposase
MIKRLTAREGFRRYPQVKPKLWGGEFWSDGYFASTVGKRGDEGMIANSVQNQGNEYLKLHRDEQLTLF